MCSITVNSQVEKQLETLKRSGEKVDVEDKLKALATEANKNQSGALDTPDCLLRGTGWSGDLADVRRKRLGRHRVFFIGHHTKCTYHTLYIKMNKKKGVEDENDSSFQQHIGRQLDKPSARTLNPEPKKEESN